MLSPQPSGTTLPASSEAPRQILMLFAVIAGILTAGMVGFYAFGLHGSLPFLQDTAGYVLGRDFLNTWFFGKAAFLPDPGRFYDHDLYMRWVNEAVPQDIFNHLWSYPPHFLLMAAPFGLLPYPAAFAAWTLAGILALYAAVRGKALRTLAILFSPAALFCLTGGQISLFMAALTIAALRLLDRRPVIAGLLIAACTIKPQMGLLFPVLLVASRRWLVLAAAALGTLALILVTGLIWGFDVWRDYLLTGLPAQMTDTKDTYIVLAPWSPTITTAMIMSGLKPETANLIQIAFTCLGAALIALGCAQNRFKKSPMDERRIVLFLACSIFAAPYLLAHDLVALTAAAVMLAAARPLDRWGNWAVKALYLLPMLQFTAGIAHIPGVALIPICVSFWALRQRPAAPEAPAPAVLAEAR